MIPNVGRQAKCDTCERRDVHLYKQEPGVLRCNACIVNAMREANAEAIKELEAKRQQPQG